MSALLYVGVDAETRSVADGYISIRNALDDNGFDLARGYRISAFIDDEGILKGLPLNVVASMFVQRALFGPAVLCAPEPDDEGNTVALDEATIDAIRGAAGAWRSVLANAAYIGQDLTVVSTPETLPPSRIIELPDDWLPGDPIPDFEGPVLTDEAGDPL